MSHRSFPAPIALFDEGTRTVFEFLLRHGLLREEYRVLDIGCGPLRVGRHLILFLNPGCYYGVEPAEQMLKCGLEEEVIRPFGERLLKWKAPTFSHVSNSDFSSFGYAPFKLVFSYQVFIHCGPEQLRQCLRSVRDALFAGGKFVFTIWLADKDRHVPKTAGEPYNYGAASHLMTFYRRDTLEAIVKEEGFKLDFIEKSEEYRFHWVVVH